MGAIILTKFWYFCLSLWTVITLTFFLMKIIPGDPFQQEQALPREIYQALRNYYGLNDPWIVQYLRYFGQLFSGDFGPSLVYKGQNVTTIIKESFPTSAFLGTTALALAIPLGLILGVLTGIKKAKWYAPWIVIALIGSVSIPNFVMATLLQYVLAIKFHFFPIARWVNLSHLILPALSLAALPTAFIARMTRTKVIEEMKQGYVFTARAKGLSATRIVFIHVLPNILPPILSYVGPLAASIMTGSFIIEKIYSIPGLGYWFVTSVSNRDYPLILGVTIFYCTLLLLLSFFIDLLNLYLDPRRLYSTTICRENKC